MSKSAGIRFSGSLVVGVMLLVAGMLAGCAAASATTPTPTQAPTMAPTSTPAPATTPTPTLAPVQCAAQFGSNYYATLPNASYRETPVYSQVQLPPETRAWEDNASGHRFKYLCSAGTTEEVLDFLHTHLTAQGWQPEALDAGRYCDQSNPNFSQKQCWKNGSFELFVGLNSNADWAMVYLDPGFLCADGGQFNGTSYATLPNATYPQTKVYAQVQLPPETQSYESDASGTRFHFMCSRTTEDVLTFMQTHLTAQGWAQAPASACYTMPSYSQRRCWKNGKYELTINLNSNLDWVVEYLDPAFLQ